MCQHPVCFSSFCKWLIDPNTMLPGSFLQLCLDAMCMVCARYACMWWFKPMLYTSLPQNLLWVFILYIFKKTLPKYNPSSQLICKGYVAMRDKLPFVSLQGPVGSMLQHPQNSLPDCHKTVLPWQIMISLQCNMISQFALSPCFSNFAVELKVAFHLPRWYLGEVHVGACSNPGESSLAAKPGMAKRVIYWSNACCLALFPAISIGERNMIQKVEPSPLESMVRPLLPQNHKCAWNKTM